MASRDKLNRRSIRRPEYNYSQSGAYFITICTHERISHFGEVVQAKMRLSLAGQAAQRAWLRLPAFFDRAKLDEFVVMPNHMHAILWIIDDVGLCKIRGINADEVGTPDDWHGTEAGSLGAIMQNYKSIVTRKVHALPKTHIQEVWQRNYWERIIRNERELHAFRKYIVYNPARWEMDSLNHNRNVGV
jgi:REP element-mobilizing transposase RayT